MSFLDKFKDKISSITDIPDQAPVQLGPDGGFVQIRGKRIFVTGADDELFAVDNRGNQVPIDSQDFQAVKPLIRRISR